MPTTMIFDGMEIELEDGHPLLKKLKVQKELAEEALFAEFRTTANLKLNKAVDVIESEFNEDEISAMIKQVLVVTFNGKKCEKNLYPSNRVKIMDKGVREKKD
jgi:hypothetical protein